MPIRKRAFQGRQSPGPYASASVRKAAPRQIRKHVSREAAYKTIRKRVCQGRLRQGLKHMILCFICLKILEMHEYTWATLSVSTRHDVGCVPGRRSTTNYIRTHWAKYLSVMQGTPYSVVEALKKKGQVKATVRRP